MCFMVNVFFLFSVLVSHSFARKRRDDVPIYSETMHAADRIKITYAIC